MLAKDKVPRLPREAKDRILQLKEKRIKKDSQENEKIIPNQIKPTDYYSRHVLRLQDYSAKCNNNNLVMIGSPTLMRNKYDTESEKIDIMTWRSSLKKVPDKMPVILKRNDTVERLVYGDESERMASARLSKRDTKEEKYFQRARSCSPVPKGLPALTVRTPPACNGPLSVKPFDNKADKLSIIERFLKDCEIHKRSEKKNRKMVQ